MKGTYSMGKHSGGKTHIICRRCGKHSYHKRKKICSSCGFGRNAKSPKFKRYSWQNKWALRKL